MTFVDIRSILIVVDMEGWMMKTNENADYVRSGIEFCDGCGSVCGDRCRTDALLDAARDKVAKLGFRL